MALNRRDSLACGPEAVLGRDDGRSGMPVAVARQGMLCRRYFRQEEEMAPIMPEGSRR